MRDIILEVPGRGMIRTVNFTGDLHNKGIRGEASGGRTGRSNEAREQRYGWKITRDIFT